MHHRRHVNNSEDSTGDNVGTSPLVMEHEALAALYKLMVGGLGEEIVITDTRVNIYRKRNSLLLPKHHLDKITLQYDFTQPYKVFITNRDGGLRTDKSNKPSAYT